MMTIHEKLEMAMKAHEYLEAANKAETVRICAKGDRDTRDSLTYAIQSFRNVLRSLEVVEDAVGYRSTEKTYPMDPKSGCVPPGVRVPQNAAPPSTQSLFPATESPQHHPAALLPTPHHPA
jgi:hypothetical protein